MTFPNSIQVRMIKISAVSVSQEAIKNDVFLLNLAQNGEAR